MSMNNNQYFDFSEILYKLREGNVIYRLGTPSLNLIWKEDNSVMCYNNKMIHSYVFNNTDIFAENWICLGPRNYIRNYLYNLALEKCEEIKDFCKS